MNDTAIFAALLKEGALSSEMLATGVTTLRKANNSNPGLFSLSFFSLSIGMERAAKIAIVLDYYLENQCNFPSDAHLKKFGHDVESLFAAVVTINRKRLKAGGNLPIPDGTIHAAIIRTLSEFGKATRYHNLDSLVQGRAASLKNPERAWFENVGKAIMQRHHKPNENAKDAARARSWHYMFASREALADQGLDSPYVTTVGAAMADRQITGLIQRHAQFYTLQIIRYFAETLVNLQTAAHGSQLQTVPFFSELFGLFMNDDAYFRSRRTWGVRR